MWTDRDIGKLKVTFTILQTHLKKCCKRLPSAHRPAPHVMNTLFKFCWSNWKHCILNVPCQIAFSGRITTAHTIILTCHTSKKWQGCESGKWEDHNLLLNISQPKISINNVQCVCHTILSPII
jgi:hypothetical protein